MANPQRPRRSWCLGLVVFSTAILLLTIWLLWGGSTSTDRVEKRSTAHHRDRHGAPSNEGQDPEVEQTTLQVTGRAIAIDKAGREHREEDGSFRLVEWTERGRARAVEVPVSKGTWRAKLLRGHRVRVTEMRLGGRPAFVEDEYFVASGGRVLALRARWQTPSLLHVVDDATGQPLSEVEVVRRSGLFHEDEFHPGGAETTPVVVDATSPVTLSPRSRLAVYWVRARGFAWGRIHVDHRGGGERQIRLRRGGALEVTLTGSIQNRRVYLSLRPEGSAPDAVPLLEREIPLSGVTRVADIQAGRYEVHVSSATWYEQPVLLGSAKAVIAADSVCALAIHLANRSDEAVAAVPLGGILVIPPAWGDIDPSLEIETARGTSDASIEEFLSGTNSRPSVHISIGSRKMVRDEAGHLHWSAGKIPPGDYVASVSSISFQVVLRAGATGNATARIELPEPAEVVLRTVDETSGALVPIKELVWGPRWVSLNPGSPQSARYSPKPGTFRLRAPVGAIRLSVSDEGWALASPEMYEVRQGTNEHTVRLVRLSGISVSFRDGDAVVPFELGADMVSLTSLDGHEDLEMRWGDGSVTFLVRHTGEYELTFGHLPGFEQVEPKRVTVRRGETETLVIDLQRKAR